jgi:hypothetical protein
MIDGRPYKSLKRHIGVHGMTPADYRARYNLPSDYPMVAPAYSDARREVARRLGLGRKPLAAAAPLAAAPPAVSEATAPTTAPKRRAPKPKAAAGAVKMKTARATNSKAKLAPDVAQVETTPAVPAKSLRGRKPKAAPAAVEAPPPVGAEPRRSRKPKAPKEA